MLKRCIAGGLAVLCGSAAAVADGMPSRAPAFAAPLTWTGLYAGLHVGHGWGSTTTVISDGNASYPRGYTSKADESGLIGGAQLGYNYQVGTLVLGLEAELSGSTIAGAHVIESPLQANRTSTSSDTLNWLAATTARLGVAQGNWLLYAKGGWAWGDFSTYSDSRTGTAFNVVISSDNAMRDGWLAGAGIEWRLDRNWSIKGEYNYVDFGSATELRHFRTGSVAGTVGIRDVTHELHLAKIGFNYKF